MLSLILIYIYTLLTPDFSSPSRPWGLFGSGHNNSETMHVGGSHRQFSRKTCREDMFAELISAQPSRSGLSRAQPSQAEQSRAQPSPHSVFSLPLTGVAAAILPHGSEGEHVDFSGFTFDKSVAFHDVGGDGPPQPPSADDGAGHPLRTHSHTFPRPLTGVAALACAPTFYLRSVRVEWHTCVQCPMAHGKGGGENL